MYREKTHTHALAYTSVALQILDRICLFFFLLICTFEGEVEIKLGLFFVAFDITSQG